MSDKNYFPYWVPTEVAEPKEVDPWQEFRALYKTRKEGGPNPAYLNAMRRVLDSFAEQRETKLAEMQAKLQEAEQQ